MQEVVSSLSNVSVCFNEQSGYVLKNFSLECRQGEFLVIVGRSGCGKTTVLNLLAGLVDAMDGDVRVLGKQPVEARKQIGYMFARDALVPSRTALKNIEIGLEVRGVPAPERRRRALELISALGLDGAEQRYPWQLSQGMRQRVALARTWALKPNLILMDEPFAALDAQTRETARAQFLELWERDRSSVIFVTHDLTEALLLGDRILLLGAHGRIIEDIKIPFKRPRNAAGLPITQEFRELEWRLRGSLVHD